jgi:hypothetical protein
MLNGVSNEKNLPLRWTTERTALEARPAWLSGSTPIIWRDHIFLNVADGNDLFLWCGQNEGRRDLEEAVGQWNVKMRKQNMSSPSP